MYELEVPGGTPDGMELRCATLPAASIRQTKRSDAAMQHCLSRFGRPSTNHSGLRLKEYTVPVGNTHLTGDLKLVADQISEWARLQAPIIRLWLFGSRARRTHSPDSDLDVALEIGSLPTKDAKGAFDLLRESWTAELSEATGLEIHFESIDLEQIQAAVTDHGVLIYERVAASPCPWLA